MKKFISLITLLIMIFSSGLLSYAETEEKIHTNTGELRVDIIGHAKSQIGYQSTEEGSKFDALTSNDTDNWSASFISWCADKAFISEESIPRTSSITELFDFFNEKQLYHSKEEYTPLAGDIIFIKTEEEISICGVVTNIDDNFVTAIVGDDENTVKKKMYDLNLPKIAGYASPDYTMRAFVTKGNYITTTDLLNFRSQPNTDSDILDRIPLGTILNITEINEGWGKTTYKEKNGYVSMDYVSQYNALHTDPRYAVNWNVIDISKYQDDIDWDKLRDEDVSAIIIRLGFRATRTKVIYEDEKFLEHYNKAKENGFHVGCYFYSGATTNIEAIEEANYIVNYIKNNNLDFDMPVYWDVEDNIIKDTGKNNICKMTKEFFSVMDFAKIYTGVYTSSSWMQDFFDPSLFSGHALWVADWRGYCGYSGDYGMWQYTENGSVAGIAGDVDKNYCYINYPLFIPDFNFNSQNPPPTISVQKGDINKDGKITASDARTVLRISAKLEEMLEENKVIADYNSDDKITASDARAILRKSAKLE